MLMVLIILLVIVVLVGITWTNYSFSSQNPGGNDFLARWNGARFWIMEGVNPYDSSVSEAAQRLIYGRLARSEAREDVAHFIYPLTSMVFFAPFGLMEYQLARALWMTLLEVSLILMAVVSIRMVGFKVNPIMMAVIAFFSVGWYHGLRTVIVGQFAGLNAFLISAAIYFIVKKNPNDTWAGALLALTTSKPQMVFILIPFILLWALSVRRYNIIRGFVFMLAGLLIVSLIFIPDWPMQMIRQMIEYPDYSPIGSPITIIADVFPGIKDQVSIVLHAILTLYLFVEWLLAWRKDERWFLWTVMLTIVITNLVAFRTATTNFVMMFPALMYIFKVWVQRWGKTGRTMAWIAGLALFIGLWILFLNTIEINIESKSMYLPLPLFTLFGLWWIRWWALRPPRLPIEEYARLD